MNLPVEEENTKHRTCKNCGVKFTIVSPPDDPRIAFCTSCALNIRARGTKWTYIGCQIETQIEKTFIGNAKTAWDAQLLSIAHNRKPNALWEETGDCEIKVPTAKGPNTPYYPLFALTPDDARFIVGAHNISRTPESKTKSVVLNQHDVQNLALAFSNIKFNSRTSKRTKQAVIEAQFTAYELGLERGRQKKRNNEDENTD